MSSPRISFALLVHPDASIGITARQHLPERPASLACAPELDSLRLCTVPQTPLGSPSSSTRSDTCLPRSLDKRMRDRDRPGTLHLDILEESGRSDSLDGFGLCNQDGSGVGLTSVDRKDYRKGDLG